MQWLATPLNALDSAIDRLTTPQRGGGPDNDNNDDEVNSNTANAGANGARSLVLDDDARAAAAEDDGFASSSSLDVGGDERNAFGAQLEIGPLDAGAAVVGGDDQSVTQQTIDINDAMGVISPLQNENDDGGEEGAFVNGIGRHGGRSMPPSDSLVGRVPPLPLHPNTKSRGSCAAMGSVPSAAAMDESQYVLETPPARIWPPQPKPQQPPVAAVDGPAADNAKPPTSQSKRSAPVSSKASSTGHTANGAGGSSTAVSGISPFPGRLVKRARPPSPVNSLTEQEEAQVKTGVEGYLSSFVGGDDGDDAGNADDDGSSAGAIGGSDVHIADATNEEEADQKRKAQEEDARLEAERIEIERQRQRGKEKEAEAERQRIAAAKERARLELLEAKRIADAKAAAEREAALKAEMERQLREEAARRIAEQRRVEAQRKAREEEEARRIAAAAEEEEAQRRMAEEEAKRELEAEAKRQAEEEAERRRAVAEEQARVAAEQARVAAEAEAENERRLQEVEEQRRQREALDKAKPNIEAPPVSAFTAPTESSGADQETDLNDTSRDDDDDLDSEYEDYEVHLPLQPWDAPLVNIGKDGRDDGAIAEMSSFSSPLPSWDPAMNRRGVVQIRLLRAQRLPCSTGRSVRANITLPPWRGKVTTEWTKAYLGPEGIPPGQGGEDQSFQDVGAGVCACWDEEDIVEPNKGDTGAEFDEVSSEAQNIAVMTYNMVHHYNDTDTPVPEISIEVTSTSMLGFESTMSVSVPLSVGVLMREPGIWRRRWCPALAAGKDGAVQPSSPRRTVSGAVRSNGESPQSFARRKITAEAFDAYGTAEAPGPLFLLEARFVPTSFNNGVGGQKEEDESDFASAHGTLEEKGTPLTQEASASLQPDGGSAPRSNQVIGQESDAVSKAAVPPHGMALESPLTITSVAAPTVKPTRPTLDAFMQAEQYKHADSDVQSVTSALTASTATKSQRRILQAKPHHLRVLPSWSSPTWCSICSTFVVPFRATCYQCETCNIVCCTDCQLRVDVRLPCGSDEAKEAAAIAKRSTVGGALGELMSVVAPVDKKVDEDIDGKISASIIAGKADQTQRTGISQDSMDGVASLRIKLVRACLFDRPYAPETDLDYILKKEGRALRVGDHYARVTWTGSGTESTRTRTVFQTARPLFDSEVMFFDIPHYGTEYRIEVIDANTDQVVGTALFPAQSLLQWQRDDISTSTSLPLRSKLDIRSQREFHKKKIIELRQGVKSGFGLDYFNTAKKKDDSPKADSTDEGRAGEISGWMECDIALQENTKGLLCGPEVQEIAPNTTPDDFRIDLVQLHIARIGALIADIKKLVGAYIYLLSWEDPVLTFVSLLVFIWLCLRFNMEYIGSLPPSMLALYMTYLWKKRRAGQFATRWVKTEREARVEAEKKLTINHSTHRPIGFIDVSVVRGKNLRSYELGLPGAAYASVFWDALHFVPEPERERIAEIDPSAKRSHEIGSTVAAGITSNPEWTTVVESAESERLKQLIPANEDAVGEAEDSATESINPLSLQFPILQPISQYANAGSNDGRNSDNTIRLVPWESSPGAIVIQICFQDALNKFALIDPYFGDVTIPLDRLAKRKEIEGWFPVNDISGNVNGIEKSFSSGTLGGKDSKTPVKGKGHGDQPQVYLKLKLTLPESSSAPYEDTSDADKEASVIIAEEMMRLSAMAEGENIGLIGTGLNTFNTVRGLNSQLQGIQNTLGGVLDTIERVRNVFNFASPNRSSIIVVCLLALWLVLAIIPTRAILLAAGLGQYGASFYAAFGKKFSRSSKKDPSPPAPIARASSAEAKSGPAAATRIANFIAGLPTDEDLRRAYFWEARREGEKAREELALKKRMLRLNRLWRAQWFGTVELKEFTSSKEADRQWDWEPVFGLVHGHRFIWWRSEKHFDDGEPPLGQIFFAGHSGLGGLSPMEMRELSREEALLIVTMFGRGVEEQQKISLLCPNAKAKEALEDAVIGASAGSKFD